MGAGKVTYQRYKMRAGRDTVSIGEKLGGLHFTAEGLRICFVASLDLQRIILVTNRFKSLSQIKTSIKKSEFVGNLPSLISANHKIERGKWCGG